MRNIEIVEYYNGTRTVLDTTDCERDAREIKRWHAEQWADFNAGMKAIRIERRA